MHLSRQKRKKAGETQPCGSLTPFFSKKGDACLQSKKRNCHDALQNASVTATNKPPGVFVLRCIKSHL
jgi:hypothetical protein